MLRLIRKKMKGEKGFTLIELLVVIIIIAILAAIAIPTFLGQRQKAQDAAAKSLVRNAMTTIEASYVENQTFDPATMTGDVLKAIEPSITFNVAAADVVTNAPTIAAVSLAKDNEVDYFGTLSTYSVASVSASTHEFGVFADKSGTADPTGNTFVKDLGDGPVIGW